MLNTNRKRIHNVINVELIYSVFDSSSISFSRSLFLLVATVSHLSSSQAGTNHANPRIHARQWLCSQDSARRQRQTQGGNETLKQMPIRPSLF